MLLIAAIVGLVLLLLIVSVVFGVREHVKGIDDRLRSDAVDRKAVTEKLAEVDQLLADNQPKLALIEADKLLHFAVKEMLYEGQPLEMHWDEVRAFEQKLDGVPELYDYVQRLRSQSNERVTLERARKGVAVYTAALKQLGVL